MKTNKTAVCPQCRRTIAVNANRFGDKTYARHKMKTSKMLDDELYGRVQSDGNAAREEILSIDAPNPLAFGIHEIDCPMSGQPLE